jgi:DNA-binding NarL/FixJ family response regulator
MGADVNGRKTMKNKNSLTDPKSPTRYSSIVRLVAQGESFAEIARDLGLSSNLIKQRFMWQMRVLRVCQKIGVVPRSGQATADYMRRHGAQVLQIVKAGQT